MLDGSDAGVQVHPRLPHTRYRLQGGLNTGSAQATEEPFHMEGGTGACVRPVARLHPRPWEDQQSMG